MSVLNPGTADAPDEAVVRAPDGATTWTAPAVAGMPFVHHVADGIVIRPSPDRRWTGSRIVDAPVQLYHRLGSARIEGLRRLTDESAFTAHFPYHLDERGNVVVGFEGALDMPATGPTHGFRQRLDASAAGDVYTLEYQQPVEADWLQWSWQRIVLMHALPARGRGLAAHGTGFVLDEEVGVLCPGISGAGKSTLARALRTDAPDAVRLLSDDRLAVTMEDAGVRLWATPWASQADVVGHGDAPLRAVVFLHHGPGTELRAVSAAGASRRLMRTLAFPFWSEPQMQVAFTLLERILATAQLFEYSWRPAAGHGEWLADALRARVAGG